MMMMVVLVVGLNGSRPALLSSTAVCNTPWCLLLLMLLRSPIPKV